MRRPDVEVHIERLVLRGLSPAGRERIGPAIEAELARLFAEGGVPDTAAGGGAIRLAGGTFRMPGRTRPGEIGRRIGRQIHAAWSAGE